MTLPPKLLKKRDELALKFVTEYPTMNNRPPDRPDLLEYCFQQGFDKCAELLMPVIVELRGALNNGMCLQYYWKKKSCEDLGWINTQHACGRCKALNNSKEWCE